MPKVFKGLSQEYWLDKFNTELNYRLSIIRFLKKHDNPKLAHEIWNFRLVWNKKQDILKRMKSI